MAHVLRGSGQNSPRTHTYRTAVAGGRRSSWQARAPPLTGWHGAGESDGREGKRLRTSCLACIWNDTCAHRHNMQALACGAKTLRGPSGAVGHRRTSARRVAEAVMAGRAQPDLGQSPAVVACAAWSGVPLRHHLATMQHACSAGSLASCVEQQRDEGGLLLGRVACVPCLLHRLVADPSLTCPFAAAERTL